MTTRELRFFATAALSLAIMFKSAAESQQTANHAIAHPETGQEASAILAAAIAAMGGQDAWGSVSDTTATGSCAGSGRADDMQVTFRWITARDQFCYESDPEHHSAVMLSGHGRPSRAGSGTSIALTNETAELLKPYHLPGQVLLNDLNDRDYYVKVVGRESVQGVNAIHLRVVRYLAQYVEKGSTQDWWLDSSTNLPIKVTYLTPGQQIEAYMPTTLIYSSWSAESGRLLVPHQQSTLLESTILLRTCTLSKLEFNSHPASTLFDAR